MMQKYRETDDYYFVLEDSSYISINENKYIKQDCLKYVLVGIENAIENGKIGTTQKDKERALKELLIARDNDKNYLKDKEFIIDNKRYVFAGITEGDIDQEDLVSLKSVDSEDITIKPVSYIYYLLEKQEIELKRKQDKEQKEKPVETLKANIKTKRRNKIEYFDLYPEIPQEERNNFKIINDDLGVGGKKEKYKRNIEAIKVLKLCEKQNRFANKDEQEILSNYVGWGGIQEAFDNRNDSWSNEYKELKELIN